MWLECGEGPVHSEERLMILTCTLNKVLERITNH